MNDEDGITPLLANARPVCVVAHDCRNPDDSSGFAQKGINLVRKIHDLVELIDMIKDLSILLPIDSDTIALLNPYAVKARYYDTIPDTLTPEKELEIADQMMIWSETVIRGFRMSELQDPI